MTKVRLKSASVLLTLLTFLLPAGCEDGEFIAGSFILTQKALSEAPYRYSRFLTSALDRMEMVDPPSKRDEENCNVRYRIEPSGKLWLCVCTSACAGMSHILVVREQINCDSTANVKSVMLISLTPIQSYLPIISSADIKRMKAR